MMKHKEALRLRRQIAADLPPLTEILRGSLLQRTIRPELKPQVQQWLHNYQLLKSKLEAICEANHAFLRPDE